MRNDGLENLHIPLNQVQSGFARLLVGASGDDRQGAVCQVLVGAGVEIHFGGIGQAVAQIHGLTFGLGLVGIQEHHF